MKGFVRRAMTMGRGVVEEWARKGWGRVMRVRAAPLDLCIQRFAKTQLSIYLPVALDHKRLQCSIINQ